MRQAAVRAATAVRSRPRVAIGALVTTVVGYRLTIWYLYMRFIPLTGDEKYYHRGASILTRWMRGVAESETALERIVARGWFMPGPIAHILPVRRFTPDIDAIRLWQGALDIILLAIAAVLIARLFGSKIAVIFFAFLGFFPDAATQSFTIWGEAHGSKILLIAFLLLTMMIIRSENFTPRQALAFAGIGLLIAWSIYLRPPFLLQVGAAVVSAMLLLAGRRANAQWRSAIGAAVIIPVVVVLAIAPWSVQVSDQSGGFVFTTNTVNVNFIHAFSDPADLEAFTGGGVDFPDIERALRQRMAETGESYVEVLANVRRELLAKTSIGDYFRNVDREIGTYLDEDETFLQRYNLILTTDPAVNGPAQGTSKFSWLLFVDNLFWYPLAFGTLYAMLRPFPLTLHHGFVPLLAKIALPAAMIQPWLSNAKFRHLGAVMPLMLLLVLLVVFAARHPDPEREVYSTWAVRSARAIQWIAIAMTVVTVAVYVI